MDRDESNDAWAPEEVALRGLPGGLLSERSSVAAESGTVVSEPEVLARLPDLDAAEPSRESGAKSDRSGGRFLSQGVATKILVGSAVLLTLAAISPFLLSDNEPEGGTSPAPNAGEAPIWNGQPSETSEAVPAPPDFSYEPDMSFNADLPPSPDFIGASQSSGTETSPQIPSVEGRDEAGASANPEQARPPGRQSRTETRRPVARANQMMTVGDSMPIPAGIYGDGYQRGYQAKSRASLPNRPSARPMSYRAVVPGVARLEGVIEKPSVRTSYDAARSSVH